MYLVKRPALHWKIQTREIYTAVLVVREIKKTLIICRARLETVLLLSGVY